MHVEGVYVDPNGKKFFIPVENNPEILASLAQDLGVSPKLAFHDVYSIDEPELLALIPRPSHALIFITPPEMYNDSRKEDGIATKVKLQDATYTTPEGVVWYPQTIGHACGLIALLHSLANGKSRDYVIKASFLDTLLTETKPMVPKDRADALYNSQPLEEAHMRAAKRGDSAPPSAAEDPGYHYIAFIKGDDGHLWELEGGVDGPIDRGMLGEEDDVLSDTALQLGVRKFLKHANGNLNFSIVALAEARE